MFEIVLKRFFSKRIPGLLEKQLVMVLIRRIDVSKIDETSFLEFIFSTIDDFGVSVAILFAGASSGHTSIECRDLACGVESPPLKVVSV